MAQREAHVLSTRNRGGCGGACSGVERPVRVGGRGKAEGFLEEVVSSQPGLRGRGSQSGRDASKREGATGRFRDPQSCFALKRGAIGWPGHQATWVGSQGEPGMDR